MPKGFPKSGVNAGWFRKSIITSEDRENQREHQRAYDREWKKRWRLSHPRPRKKRKPVEQRFFAKIEKTDSCWTWRGAKLPNGYGRFYADGRLVYAHRFSFFLKHGCYPRYTIDHLCRNRSCVNPEHLEDVTIRENTLRGDSVAAKNARKTHCPFGHEYVTRGTTVKFRKCMTCDAERHRRKRVARRYEESIPSVSWRASGS